MILKISECRYKYMDLDEGGCGDVAFYFNSEVKHNAMIPYQLAVFPNGEQPKQDGRFRCGSCDRLFDLIILEYVRDNESYKKGRKDAD